MSKAAVVSFNSEMDAFSAWSVNDEPAGMLLAASKLSRLAISSLISKLVPTLRPAKVVIWLTLAPAIAKEETPANGSPANAPSLLAAMTLSALSSMLNEAAGGLFVTRTSSKLRAVSTSTGLAKSPVSDSLIDPISGPSPLVAEATSLISCLSTFSAATSLGASWCRIPPCSKSAALVRISSEVSVTVMSLIFAGLTASKDAAASLTESPWRLSRGRLEAMVMVIVPNSIPNASACSPKEAARPASRGLALVKFAENDGSVADGSISLSCSASNAMSWTVCESNTARKAEASSSTCIAPVYS